MRLSRQTYVGLHALHSTKFLYSCDSKKAINTKNFIPEQFIVIKVQLLTHTSLHYGFPWICSVNASLASRPVYTVHFCRHLINCLLYKTKFHPFRVLEKTTYNPTIYLCIYLYNAELGKVISVSNIPKFKSIYRKFKQ